ncbi:MAG TPA: GNAT family N-acetyltransferase, partial [Steroidobacteraceae bacterium]
MHPLIRRAYRSDAALVSRLAESTFRETFAGANTPQNMDLHCRDSYSEELQAGEIAGQNMVTLVAEQGQDLVGFAQLHWSAAPSFVQGTSPGEIQRLYVASNWHGKGVAQALMAACLEEMSARGADVAWLGVWERNPR